MNQLKLLFPYILLAAVVGVIAMANVRRDRVTVSDSIAHKAACAPCGMEVDPESAITEVQAGQTHYFCGTGCHNFFLKKSDKSGEVEPVGDDRLVDVVCQMEVNSNWGIDANWDGKTFHFCTKKCREQFLSDPTHYLSEKCLVCKAPLDDNRSFPATYLSQTYHLCSQEHRTLFKAEPATFFMHTMWGIPSWLYYASVAIILVVSFGVFDFFMRKSWKQEHTQANTQTHADDTPHKVSSSSTQESVEFGNLVPTRGGAAAIALPVLNRSFLSSIPFTDSRSSIDVAKRSDRFDLLSIGIIKTAFNSRIFRFSLQAIVTVLFLIIIAAGLWGNQNPALNIAPILTWTIWWGCLIILIMFAGKAWCYVCPWDAIAGWTEKLAFWRKKSEGLSLGLKWPRIVRNVLIATILFVGLTWVELGFGVTMKPRVTAYLAISMLLMAVVSALLFDRKSFCRYGCLVGRVSGLYALFASTEVRAKSDSTCKACASKECVQGSETAYGCPTFLYPGKLETNTYCIQCIECIQACPHDNLAVNLRPWASDLAVEGKPRTDEAYLALLMLAITGFHGLTMTPVWQEFVDAIRSSTGFGRTIGFSVGMAILMLSPIAIYAVLVAASRKLAQGHTQHHMSYHDYFVRYAYALLPIALFYHIAHNMEHLLMEGPKVIAMISDPFGWNWNLFGTASWTIPPLISLEMLWIIQVFLVLVGHLYSLWVAHKTSLRLFGTPKAALRSQLPMLAGMVLFSVFSLWLLKQPMEMRTSGM